jgi:hypothetical protein
MRLHCTIFRGLTIAALLCAPVLGSAQTPTTAAPSASPPGKSSVKVDMVPSLFVMNARGAGLQGQTLTLSGVIGKHATKCPSIPSPGFAKGSRQCDHVRFRLPIDRVPQKLQRPPDA